MRLYTCDLQVKFSNQTSLFAVEPERETLNRSSKNNPKFGSAPVPSVYETINPESTGYIPRNSSTYHNAVSDTNHGTRIWLHLPHNLSFRGQQLSSVKLACQKTGGDSPVVITMQRFGFYSHSADWGDCAPAESNPYRCKVTDDLTFAR